MSLKEADAHASHARTHVDIAPARWGSEWYRLRLGAFRCQHPDIIIGGIEFGCWQALIFAPDAETVVVRHSLKELLDKLNDMLSQSAQATEEGCAVSGNIPEMRTVPTRIALAISAGPMTAALDVDRNG